MIRRQFDFPDLPKLPEDLKQAVMDNQLDFVNYHTFKAGEGRKILKNGEAIPSSSFRIRKGPEDVIKWIETHITKNFSMVGTTESDPEKTICGPHLDKLRNYTLIYPLHTGGEKVSTVFYRLKSLENPAERQYYLDYDELEEIDRVVIPAETWCVVNSKCIHSVEGLTSKRLTLQVGLWEYVGLPDLR
jgi:hypothetical protein